MRPPTGNQLLTDGTEKMGLAAPRIAERQHIFAPVQQLAFDQRLGYQTPPLVAAFSG